MFESSSSGAAGVSEVLEVATVNLRAMRKVMLSMRVQEP